MSKPKKIRKKVPLIYYKGDSYKNRRLVLDKGSYLWFYDIVKRDFITNEESKDADRNNIIPVIAINKKNAIKKVAKIIFKLASAHKILEEVTKYENQHGEKESGL